MLLNNSNVSLIVYKKNYNLNIIIFFYDYNIMKYSIVYPYPTLMDAESFKEAIKEYVKINRNFNINQMIITDKMSHVNAELNYYRKNNVDKVGINMYPISPNYTIYPNFYGPVHVQSLIPDSNNSSILYSPTRVHSFIPTIVNLEIPNNL